MKKIFQNTTACLLLIAAAAFTSCEEGAYGEVLPYGEIAYVNFVNAGEVFTQGLNDELSRDNVLYIGDSLSLTPHQTEIAYHPIVFTRDVTAEIRQYPVQLSGGSISDLARADVFWFPILAGEYPFLFTSKDRTYLKTENVLLNGKSYNMVYLVESPESASAYAIVNVPVEFKDRAAGKTTVQFVNLSPDAGEVELYRVDAAGSETADKLPLSLSFGSYQSMEFSVNEAESTYGRYMLRFRRPGAGDILNFSLPADDGAVYTVLLRGFEQPALRSVKKDNENDAEVSILPDLRVTIRRVFY